MKFFVIEGVDGSGKSTQIKLLLNYLDERNIRYRYLHFPRTDSPVYGDLIARFLRGDFGPLHAVDPYLVALMYAGDRLNASEQIRVWLNDGEIVILDRYVYSNIAFQCAKIREPEKQEELRRWILDLEYQYNKIPKPELNILLDVPFAFTKQQLSVNRAGNERDYLRGQRDIHEEDLNFQQQVRACYLWQASLSTDLKIISCADAHHVMLPPDAVFRRILETISL